MSLILKLSPLFFAAFFLFMGDGLFLSSAGVKLTEVGVSNVYIGLVNACFFLGATLSAVAAHRVISRVGHARTFSIFSALFGVGALLHILTGNLILWSFLRIIQGFCYYGLLMVTESWINEKCQSSIRSRVLAIYEVVFYSAFAVGILLMGLSLSNTDIFIFSAIFVVFSLVPVSFSKLPEPKIPPKDRISIPRVFNIVPLALTGAFVGGIAINGFFTMASVYVLELGFSVKQVSYFMVSAMIGGFTIQFPIGKVSDAYGRRCAFMIVTVTTLLAIIAMSIFAKDIKALYLSAFFLGCGIFTYYPLSMARANDMLSDNASNVVEISRCILFVYGLGALVSPLVLGVSIDLLGSLGFDLSYGILATILFLTALSQKSVPKDKRSVYVPMQGTSSDVMSELDPRHPEKPTEEEHSEEENSRGVS